MGNNISTDIIEEFASINGCRKGERPNMYLGLPLKGNHKFFFPFSKTIIEKIERRLSTWSSYYTSKGGKTDPNTSHIIQPPRLLHVSIWNATKNGQGYRKNIHKLLVERWPTPCLMEYYKPPTNKGRPWSFLCKEEEQSSPRQMDGDIIKKKRPCGEIL